MKRCVYLIVILAIMANISVLPAGATAVGELSGIISRTQEPPGNKSGTLRVYVLTGDYKGKTMTFYINFENNVELIPEDILSGEFVGTDWVMKNAMKEVRITYVECLDEYGGIYYDVDKIELVE